MTITPTALLSLPLITTGTESGTWGDVVDNGLTAYLDIAIAGSLAISIAGSGTTVTLANTAGTSSATGIASTTAQYAILNISGVKTGACTLVVPQSSRRYYVINAGTGGFLLTVKGTGTGVTLVDGEKAVIAWNGSDFVKVANQNGMGAFASTPTITTASTYAVQTSGTNGGGFAIVDGANAISLYSVAGVLNFGLGATTAIASKATLDANGNFTAIADITAYSDERLKTNWRGFGDNFTELLAQIKCGVYDRVDMQATQVGVSAQSLRTLMPDAVMEGSSGMLSVAYGNAALAACVELAKHIVKLEARLNVLEK